MPLCYTRLDEAPATQMSGQAVQLTIDAAKLRCADAASMRTLMAAAAWARTGGSVTLLNPQPPVARMLGLLCAVGMVAIRGRAAVG